MNRRHLPTALAATAAAVLAFAAPASAEVRWAGPSGSTGAACSENDPCRIDTAVGGAGAGAEVILKTGTYNIGYAVAANAAIDVHGEAGQPRPRLLGGTGLGATLDMSFGGTLTNVYVSTGRDLSYAVSVEGAVIDRVIAEASGTAYGALELRPNPGGVVVRNSTARGLPGSTSDAIQVKDNGKTGNVTVIGTTALSAGNRGIAVKTSAATSTVKNSIFRGSTDIWVSNIALAPQVSNTNYRPASSTGTINTGSGNQAASPAFVDEANGNLEQADGAPTIDAGGADALTGTLDVAGQPRVSGSGVDIGAHERQEAAPPPPNPTPDPTPDSTAGTSGGSGTSSGNDSGSSSSGSGTSTSTSGSSGPDTLPPVSDPVLGLSVTLGEVKGAPLVRLPGTDVFVALTADATVPVGAIVDATKGTVELRSVRDASGQTQTGTFSGGVFQIRQSRHDTVTELVLVGGDFGSCKAKRSSRGKVVAAGRRHSATVRRLWGRDRGGRFRTRGRNGSATVRGTRWLTEDRCDGTLFKVAEGAIDVRDDGARKTVHLKRGKSYLAAAPAAKKRRR